MKYLFLHAITLLVFLVACQTETPPPTSTPAPRIAVDVGVVVADMDQSLGFYQDLLGLPVIADITTSLIGKGRMVQLKHGESLIKLVQMEAPPNTQPPAGITSAFGYRYITLMVTNIAAIHQKIQANDIPVFLPLTELGNGAQILMVEDPAGNIVEFVQEA